MAIPLRTLIAPAVRDISIRFRAMGGLAPMALLSAIGLQESKFQARDQLEMQNGVLVAGRPGPAMGFWQFELNGGVAGTMRHPASREAAVYYCQALGVPFEKEAIWREFGTPNGDELAAAFARLYLLTDPQPLPMPTPENEDLAWEYYTRVWKPGKPHREFWGANWAEACAAVNALGDDAAGGVVAAPSAPVGTPATTLPIVDTSATLRNALTHLSEAERLLNKLLSESTGS